MQRAYEHYRWAERYRKQGEHAKAKAHMARAVHYGYKRSAFGFGGDATSTGRGGAMPMDVDESYATAVAEQVNLVFVLAPVNGAADSAIRAEIDAALTRNVSVEVYMQAFSETDPSVSVTPSVGNLLPMNFNQYSSDDPNCLVTIMNAYSKENNVTFYIFSTQTTKNSWFLDKCKARMLEKLNALLKSTADQISPWILASIVGWLRKDEKDSFARDVNLGRLVENWRVFLVEIIWRLNLDNNANGHLPVQPIFDPFCVHWASYKGTAGGPTAKPIPVIPYSDDTAPSSKESGYGEMNRPRFRRAVEGETTNCFSVTWELEGAADDEDAKKAVKKAVEADAVKYIDDLWNSFKVGSQVSRSARRKVLKVFVEQDYYDYDNRMGVWYAVDSIDAASVSLFSVSRPVADRSTMIDMRRNAGGGAPWQYTPFFGPGTKPHLITASEEDVRAFPMWPVLLEKEYASRAAAVNSDGAMRARRDGTTLGPFGSVPKTVSDLKTKLYDWPATQLESSAIAYTWIAFLCHYIQERSAATGFAYTDNSWKVTNGGYTSRHGMHPVMHTLVDDWLHTPLRGYVLEPKDAAVGSAIHTHAITKSSVTAVGEASESELTAMLNEPHVLKDVPEI